MQNHSLGERMKNCLKPVIIPIVAEFTLRARKKRNNRVFMVVSHPLYMDAQRVREWVEARYGGHWVTPTIEIAGDTWQINPKYTDFGWCWLLLKA